VARPVKWTPEKRKEVGDYICEELAKGRSLRSICQDPDMPAVQIVLGWRDDDAAFYEQYTRAREAQADHFADEITEIADTETDPNRARVRIDARKWAAGKLKPKTYGDRLQLDGDMQVKLTDDQLERRLAQLLGKAGIAAAVTGEGKAEDAA